MQILNTSGQIPLKKRQLISLRSCTTLIRCLPGKNGISNKFHFCKITNYFTSYCRDTKEPVKQLYLKELIEKGSGLNQIKT